MTLIFFFLAALLLFTIGDFTILFAELHKYDAPISRNFEKRAGRYWWLAILLAVTALITAGVELVDIIHTLTK